MTSNRATFPWATVGAISAGIAVILGAVGSHALRSKLGDDSLRAWTIGTDYQLAHGLALLFLDHLQYRATIGSRRIFPVGILFSVGIILFCGSLYGLALTSWSFLGPITPFGGICFILGWCLLAQRTWAAYRTERTP